MDVGCWVGFCARHRRSRVLLVLHLSFWKRLYFKKRKCVGAVLLCSTLSKKCKVVKLNVTCAVACVCCVSTNTIWIDILKYKQFQDMWSTRRQRMWYSSVCTCVETICLLYWHVSLLLLHTTVLTHPEWGHLTSQWCNNVIFIPTVKNHEKIQVMSHSQKNLVYKAAKFLQQVLWWFRECPDTQDSRWIG